MKDENKSQYRQWDDIFYDEYDDVEGAEELLVDLGYIE